MLNGLSCELLDGGLTQIAYLIHSMELLLLPISLRSFNGVISFIQDFFK